MAVRMTRKIVIIDEDKCDGCGLCIPNCAEGAIQIIDGKARLVGENLCDGLGHCLGTCPRGAIRVEQREAEAYDEAAVEAHRAALRNSATASDPMAPSDPMTPDFPGACVAMAPPACGCPGSRPRVVNGAPPEGRPEPAGKRTVPSELKHWPVQIALLPPEGAMWQDADVLIAADCVGFAMPDMHERLLKGKTVAVGCPKLDDLQLYVRKLTAVFIHNRVRSVTIAHMEVPCCNGIVTGVRQALQAAGRADIPVRDVTVGVAGTILRDQSDGHVSNPR